MENKTSPFGATKEQCEQVLKSSAELTAEWLLQKYQEEKNRLRNGRVIGIDLKKYHEISSASDGLRKGLITVIAKSHVGKSTFMIDLNNDILLSNNDTKVVFYSLDDDKDELRVMMIANLAGVWKNIVEVQRTSQNAEELIKAAYDFLADMARKGRFVVKDFEDVENIGNLVKDIESEFDERYRLVVLSDGFVNIESSGANVRVQHINRANKIMRCANKLEIPIVITTEVPKSAPLRVTRSDIMESNKYEFNSKLCICLSHNTPEDMDKRGRPKNGELRGSEMDIYPNIHFKIDKNKYGGCGEVFFRFLDGAKSRFINPPSGLYDDLLQLGQDAEKADYFARLKKGKEKK